MKKAVVILVGFLVVVVGAAILFALWGIGINNKLVNLSQAVDAKWADVQTVYQRRADLIPNLVNTVSGAANFEKSTLTEVTVARASVGKVQIDTSKAPTPEAMAKFQAAQDQLSSALSRLLVVAERYPELRATQNFRDLQAQLEGTENRISVARHDYNDVVRDYNSTLQRFPGSIIAGMRGFKEKAYFKAAEGAEKAPEVKFDFNSNKTAPAK